MKHKLDFLNYKSAIFMHGLQIHDIQAINGSLIGPPQPTALLGFMHALNRKVATRAVFTDIAIFSEMFKVTEGYPKLEATTKSAPISEDPKGEMNCSLVIRVDELDPSDIGQLQFEVTHALKGMRLSGGTVWFKKDNITVLGTESSDEDKIEQVLRLKNCSVLRDRTDLMSVNEAGVDTLTVFLDALSSVKGQDGKFHKNIKGWIVPVMSGYRSVTPIAKIVGLRENAPVHTWVEEVLTLGEWITFSKANKEDFRNCFWRYENEGIDNGLFLTSAISK